MKYIGYCVDGSGGDLYFMIFIFLLLATYKEVN